MSQFVENRRRTFTASGAIPQYSRVKLVAGQIAVAGGTDVDLGVTDRPTFVAGENVTVLLRNQGTLPMIAAGAIAAGDMVWTAPNGQVVDATGAVTGELPYGQALDAATAAGSIIEVLAVNPGVAHA